MTSRGHFPDEPELLPPAELLRLRAALVRPPSSQVRTSHLAAIAAAARDHSSSPAGRFASRTVRGAAAVIATLAITSGLAAAQVLPAPAQRIFSSVSDRFTPDPPAPPATAGATQGVDDPASSPSRGDGFREATPSGGSDDPTAPASAIDDATTSTTEAPTTTTTHPIVPTTTTIPGPSGPGSPDPTDPGTTDGGPTDPGSTDGGPTDPGSGEPTDPGTVGTTEVPPTVPPEDAVAPAGGSD